MNNEKFGELVGASVANGVIPTAEAVADTLTNEELLQAVATRGLAVGAVAVEASDQPSTDEKPEDILTALSPEKQARAQALKQAMAEKFGLSPKDFGLVKIEKDEAVEALPEPKVVVMLTTGNGLYKGSFDKIMDKKSYKDFVIEVNGERIDTRKAMTWDTYKAFITQSKASGVNPLPDSRPLSEQNDQPWTGTWLTGELPPDELYAYYGDVYGDMPGRYWGDRYDGCNDVRVRPSAVV